MSSVTPTFNNTVEMEDRSVLLPTWALATANPDGLPLNKPSYTQMTWTAQGTWGGATLTLQGSNDGTNWFPLTKFASSTAATFTADGIVTTNEAPLYVRPNLTVAGAGATINVVLVAIRATPVRT
jgi:hypothetical protein